MFARPQILIIHEEYRIAKAAVTNDRQHVDVNGTAWQAAGSA
jgi:hypothetical protein